ncbi:hypothetical protein THOM_1095, partial [Trachipleistophora hominis]
VMIELIIYANSLEYAQIAQKCFDKFSSVKDTLRFKLIKKNEVLSGLDVYTEETSMGDQTLIENKKLDVEEKHCGNDRIERQKLEKECVDIHPPNSVGNYNESDDNRMTRNRKIDENEKVKTRVAKSRKRSKKNIALSNGPGHGGTTNIVVKTQVNKHGVKNLVCVVIVRKGEDFDGYYDFLIHEDECTGFELENVIITIYNYKKILIQDLKVVDENNNRIKRDVIFYTKNVPYLVVENVMKLDKKNTKKKIYLPRK